MQGYNWGPQGHRWRTMKFQQQNINKNPYSQHIFIQWYKFLRINIFLLLSLFISYWPSMVIASTSLLSLPMTKATDRNMEAKWRQKYLHKPIWDRQHKQLPQLRYQRQRHPQPSSHFIQWYKFLIINIILLLSLYIGQVNILMCQQGRREECATRPKGRQ